MHGCLNVRACVESRLACCVRSVRRSIYRLVCVRCRLASVLVNRSFPKNMTAPTNQAALIAELRDNRNDFPSYLHSLCRVAADEIEQQSKIIKTECDDWASDHTHLQNLCRSVGYDESAVGGDSYGIKSIAQLADMLHAKFIALDKACCDRLPKGHLDKLSDQMTRILQ